MSCTSTPLIAASLFTAYLGLLYSLKLMSTLVKNDILKGKVSLWSERLEWSSKLLPVVAPALLGWLNYYLVTNCNFNANEFNSAVSLALQVSGGILILYSIDSKIAITRNQSLRSLFISFVQSFPSKSRSFNAIVMSSKIRFRSGTPISRMTKYGASIEDRMSALEDNLEWMEKHYNNKSNELANSLNKTNQRVNEFISAIHKETNALDTKIRKVSVGDLKWQITGVLLFIHGAIAGYFS